MNPKQLLLHNIEIATIHAEKLNLAINHLQDFFPMTEQKLSKLSYNQNAYLDVIAIRYDKLQDIIGSKIFYLLLEIMAEPVKSNRFLDVLAHLEKIGILESVEFWIELRNLRNFIAHEYPEDPALLVKNINLLYKAAIKLLAFWQKLLREISYFNNSSK